jgi:RNA polymerase sigma factor (sigma-70 family)
MSYIEKSEAEIIEGCKKSDREAQKSLYKLYYGKMNGVSFRYTNSYDDAKDIVHDSFILVFEKIIKYNGTGSLEGWIRRIVINKSLDFLNKRNRLYSQTTETEQKILNDSLSNNEYKNNSESEQLDSVYSSGFRQEEILDAIDLLKDTYRIVFHLSIVEGFSHKEISETLKIKEELSRIRLKRARAALQSILIDLADKKRKITNQTNAESIR